jgi:hypothetical protein
MRCRRGALRAHGRAPTPWVDNTLRGVEATINDVTQATPTRHDDTTPNSRDRRLGERALLPTGERGCPVQHQFHARRGVAHAGRAVAEQEPSAIR